MREVIPGVFQWTAQHEPIGSPVSSHFVVSAATVIDPKLPDEGLDALPGRPQQVLLSSGHHLRDARAFAEAFGIPIRAIRQAVDHLGPDAGVEPVDAGRPVADGVVPLHIGVISDDEGAVHLTDGDGALLVADGVNHVDDELAFFPDSLLGDDPEAVKAGLRDAYAALADELAFEALLFAHGAPIASGGRAALRAFAAA